MRIAVRYGLLSLVLTVAALPLTATGSGQFKDLLNKVKQSTQTSSSPQLGNNLPTSDIAAGLKEALAKGTTNAINSLGRDGGFWNNSKVRIPLPGKLEQAGKLARQLGQGARVDAFELSMNRAAEKAVPQVAEIFGDAIRKMTLDDARGILAGGDHAATDFFRRTAGDALTARIHPIVAKATDSVGVTQKYKSFTAGGMGGELGGVLGAFGGGNSNKGGSPLDLDDYVTAKTLDGLFTTIGEQEQSIRHNPAARTTDLLKKVFGG
ncbi:hypothetical protein RHOFW104T7_05755 [Rhodanobacter thiooxydans]|uniref:DUF4197 domain-containing protein n=1 Tax=Rhodanobacter thiooxydans TaxID=416169 RepID=A0A154QL66_9GAMM|nr:DUF4197 domain-containing protein [Rhodanobacter thiooxydans]EIL99551.1 hypothetical protein UUA_08491 [Rhodanobacter thiooxydans LCS2]KZC25014.1 hypothetical protein RHOFW104T7_05755 [Rhodanobacter thiooxydans]MCW0202816.1 DUF4197 domain-containing protein [Rhodanobacter thiooxydans]